MCSPGGSQARSASPGPLPARTACARPGIGSRHGAVLPPARPLRHHRGPGPRSVRPSPAARASRSRPARRQPANLGSSPRWLRLVVTCQAPGGAQVWPRRAGRTAVRLRPGSPIMPNTCADSGAARSQGTSCAYGAGSVKPSAQPTLVRTQHLPPAKVAGHDWYAKIARLLKVSGVGNRRLSLRRVESSTFHRHLK
jgi:hypothetical protein